MARENALLAMLNIALGGPEVKKGMFEYEGLMSCLVKVRIMDERQHKQNSSNDTTMLKVYIAGNIAGNFIQYICMTPLLNVVTRIIPLPLQMYNANKTLPIALILTLVVYF